MSLLIVNQVCSRYLTCVCCVVWCVSTCTAINVPRKKQKTQTETKQNKKNPNCNTPTSAFLKPEGGGVVGSGVVSSVCCHKATQTGLVEKLDPAPFHTPPPPHLTSRSQSSSVAATKTPPFSRIDKNVLSSPLSSLFFSFSGRKEKLPSVSQNRR